MTADRRTCEAAYGLDATASELIWTVGPLLVAVTISLSSTAFALLLSTLITLTGCVWFVRSSPPVLRRQPAAARSSRSVLSQAGMPSLLGSIVAAGFVIGVAEVTIPALAVHLGSRQAAGLLLAVWNMASIAGGLWYSARLWRLPVSLRYVGCILVAALGTGSLMFAGSIPTALTLVVAAGVAYAPMISCQNLLLGELAPRGRTTEAFTWGVAALTTGIGIGSATAGLLVQAGGVSVAFGAGCAGAMAGCGLALVAHRDIAARLRFAD